MPQIVEPEIEDRVYVRHHHTGDRGYYVMEGDRQRVRYDRPSEVILVPVSGWVEEPPEPAMSRQQLVTIAYAADQALCFLLGYHHKAERSWESLTEEQRILWAEEGPKNNVYREGLYSEIMNYLAGL